MAGMVVPSYSLRANLNRGEVGMPSSKLDPEQREVEILHCSQANRLSKTVVQSI
jgi:hypothetical protein|tara:strand:- start:15463 stop:15624 length:162 start_codon:yes stop_codon:yes gene_type:complete